MDKTILDSQRAAVIKERANELVATINLATQDGIAAEFGELLAKTIFGLAQQWGTSHEEVLTVIVAAMGQLKGLGHRPALDTTREAVRARAKGE